jgi:DNA-binding transcriptional regulator YdaS (Cro superfamily)
MFDKIKICMGSQAELARQLGIGVAAVTHWKRRGRIPADRVLSIERLTNGQVTRHEMRPDLYPVERVSP